MRAADKKRKRSLANHRFLLISVVGLLFIASFLVSRSLRSALPDPTKHEGVGRGVAEVLLQGPLLQGPLAGHATDDKRQGSILLLHFWGLWCPPCLRELPLIASLNSEFDPLEGVRVVSVVCGVPGMTPTTTKVRQRAERYLSERGMELAIYTDTSGTTRRTVAMALGDGMYLAAYPTTLLLDQQGVIRAVWVGYHAGTRQQMAQQINRLLDPTETNVCGFSE